MIPDRNSRIRDIFVQAIDLDKKSRAKFLDQECGDEPEIRAEVESLLSHHAPDTILPEGLPDNPIAAAASGANQRPFRRIFATTIREIIERGFRHRFWRNMILFALGILLSGVGIWMYWGMEESLRKILATKLESLLDADIAALEIWMEDKKSSAEVWAQQRNVLAATKELVALAQLESTTREDLLNSPALARIREELHVFHHREGNSGFAVIDRTGRVLASERDDDIGVRLEAGGMAELAKVLANKTTITKPFPQGAFAPDQTIRRDVPVVWANAPVHNAQNEIIAVLGFGWLADHQFTRVLSVGRMGRSGETYAFDSQGLLLSESRFDPELRRIGLIPDTPDSRSIFTVHVRDPGGNLLTGYRPKTALRNRPLTKIAAEAVASRTLHDPKLRRGVILDPYRDYRGVQVIGAWQWLSQYNMGVVSEVDSEEAYELLRYPIVAFWIRTGCLALAIGGLLIAAARIAILKKKVGTFQRLGQYSLLRKIGEGGMGEVYLARHALLRRPTAVKLLKGNRQRRDDVRRFEREVQLASQLEHPNTIEIYDYGRTSDQVFFYAMEYLPGISLAELVALSGPLPAARVIFLLRQICGSLREAHSIGLIHRDVKPQNIMLCDLGGEADFVKVLDFGLVKSVSDTGGTKITSPAMIVGTPMYMSPERLQTPDDVDDRSDIYSVGAVAYFLLTGQQLFDGMSQMEIVYHAVNEMPVPPSEIAKTAVPPALDRLVMDCLAKSPASRPRNIPAVLAILEELAEDEVWTTHDARKWWDANVAKLRTTTAIATLLETLPGAAETVAQTFAASSPTKQ
ncbi:serine/threonine protein kinase [Symmachiella dynata]|uniref:serine/threonine protein kinase n=1 Tax=Symmachiella dynata TaxID=2527995 RepID=UPI0030EDF94D